MSYLTDRAAKLEEMDPPIPIKKPAPFKMPDGIYQVRLYGRSGAVLYEATFPPRVSFQYQVPMSVGGIEVTGFDIAWYEP